MPRPHQQDFLTSNSFPANAVDMLGVPLLYSHASEESETGGGGGGPYRQPATPGLQQDSYGTQLAGGGSHYTTQAQREHHRNSSARLPPDHGQNAFDFSALPTGQSIGYRYQQSHGAVGVYAPHDHGSREPHVFYSNDARAWNAPVPQRHDHTRPSTADHLGGQTGFYRRGGARDIPGLSPQHLRPGPGLSSPSAFQLQGQRHIYTDQGRPGPYPTSPSRSGGNISPIAKSESPASISLSLSAGESTRYQPIEDWLRENAGLTARQPISLWSLPDPPAGSRPNVTYKVLVSLAIWGSPSRRLSLQEIYSEIENRFAYYKNLPDESGRDGKSGGKKWQRSVRHNLSLESIFHNEGRDISEPGKGGYWSLTNRNGYGQKRERKRKGKLSSSHSSRDLHVKHEDDDDFDDEDDEDGSHDDHASSYRSRHSHSRPGPSCSPPYPISSASPISMNNVSVSYNTMPTYGQTNTFDQSNRSRLAVSRTSSTPLPIMNEPDPRMYPTRPSTVPIFQESSYGQMGASGQEYIPQGQGQSSYSYAQMEADESNRHLRGDKLKRRDS